MGDGLITYHDSLTTASTAGGADAMSAVCPAGSGARRAFVDLSSGSPPTATDGVGRRGQSTQVGSGAGRIVAGGAPADSFSLNV
jgi:hypothetical protein